MNLDDLLQVVRPSGILEPDKILDAIGERNTSKTLPHRAALWPEENVATAKYMSRCIQGECRSALLDGDVTSYDMENGYTRHCITDNNDAGIVVELGTMCMINHIRMLLWDRDSRAYSYFVEVSGNQQHWERVVDYSEYHCRSWQYLYFEARPVRYLRLVGTQNTVNRVGDPCQKKMASNVNSLLISSSIGLPCRGPGGDAYDKCAQTGGWFCRAQSECGHY